MASGNATSSALRGYVPRKLAPSVGSKPVGVGGMFASAGGGAMKVGGAAGAGGAEPVTSLAVAVGADAPELGTAAAASGSVEASSVEWVTVMDLLCEATFLAFVRVGMGT